MDELARPLIRPGLGADSPAEEDAGVRHLIAYHFGQALRIGDDEAESATRAMGSPSWAQARWHLHMAQALQGLQGVDHDAAVQWVRTKTLNALAGKKVDHG